MGKLGKLKIEYYRERKKIRRPKSTFPTFPNKRRGVLLMSIKRLVEVQKSSSYRE